MPDSLTIEIRWSDEDETYVVRVPELPGCVTHGETLVEAVAMAADAVGLYLESLKGHD